jgi:farnesyl diphosphate synthase
LRLELKHCEQSIINMPTTLKEFESVWPRIVADLQDHCKGYKLPQQSLDWFTKVLALNNATR